MRQATGEIVSYAFFKTDDVTKTQRLFVSRINVNTVREVIIYNSGKGIMVNWTDNSMDMSQEIDNLSGNDSVYFKNNTWHHIVVAAQNTSNKPEDTIYNVYVDGVVLVIIENAIAQDKVLTITGNNHRI